MKKYCYLCLGVLFKRILLVFNLFKDFKQILLEHTCLQNEIEILLCESRNVDARVSFDGQANINLQAGDRIVIRQHENKLLLIHPEDYDYYHILRSKLGWSATPP